MSTLWSIFFFNCSFIPAGDSLVSLSAAAVQRALISITQHKEFTLKTFCPFKEAKWSRPASLFPLGDEEFCWRWFSKLQLYFSVNKDKKVTEKSPKSRIKYFFSLVRSLDSFFMFVSFTVSFFVCLISFTVNLTLIKLHVSPVPPSVASMTWSQQPVLHPRALSVASPSLRQCFQWMQLSQVSTSTSHCVSSLSQCFHCCCCLNSVPLSSARPSGPHQHRPVFPVCPFFPSIFFCLQGVPATSQ